MSETRATARHASEALNTDDPHKALRQLGARAHQLRAATRAADHFNALDTAEDRYTGSWLVSSVLALAADIAADLDSLARAVKERPVDANLRQAVASLRVRAHQLHAAVRAADHYLDQETREDHDTGGWLVATALTLAHKLAGEIDDGTVPAKRGANEAADIDAHEPVVPRRMAATPGVVRGAA
jgi:hypothetical protein